MRAIVQDSYGTADVLRPAELDVPTPGPRDVLIEVRAAGLDRGTWHLMTGTPHLVRLAGPRRPRNRVPGLDVAGVVAAIGAEVTRFAVGDEVFGAARGSFAEFALAREDKLARKPAGVSMVEAGTLAVSGVTAVQAVDEAGRVQAGQRVLVTGASGGVGMYAVQLAASRGAIVTGVCSTAKAEAVAARGASRVLDYRTEDPLADADAYDVIIDIAGGAPVGRLRRALAPRGTLVLVGNEQSGSLTGGMGRMVGATLLSPLVRQRVVMLVSVVTDTRLTALAQLVDDGAITPAVDQVLPLESAADAMRLLESGVVRGKNALVVS